MRRVFAWVALILLLAPFLAAPAAAQAEDESLRFSLRRVFGLGLGEKIQGRFSALAEGPDDLLRVDFYVDGQLVYSDGEPPFRFDFSTSQFSPGAHSFYAIGHTLTGGQLRSPTVEVEILSAEQARRVMVGFLLPLGGLIIALMVLGVVVTALMGRRGKGFQLGRYGLAGGAVCRHCGLPFSRHLWAPNMVVGKLERCPHCGRWSLARRAWQGALREAEARYRERLAGDQALAGQGEEDRLRALLEESRYIGED